MSGGHFDYQQGRISDIADSIECLIAEYEDASASRHNSQSWVRSFSKETIEEFKTAVDLLRQSYVYAQRIDWLVSADDSEKDFHDRLSVCLNDIKLLGIHQTLLKG
jgi:hypothetical protein